MKLKNATPIWRQFALVAVVAGSAVTASETATAQFRIVDSSGWSNAGHASGSSAKMSVSPTEGIANPLVTGFGNNLPLSVMLSQVLPEDYNVFYANSDVKDIRGSWTGDRPLTDVLDSLSALVGVNMTLDTDAKNLLVSVASGADGGGRLKVNGKYAVASSAASLNGKRAWNLNAQETLTEALTRWTSIAGWNLVWDLEDDYPINVDAKVHGDLVEAVTKLVNSYHQQGALEDAEFVFKKGNRTLVVRKFNQNIEAEGQARAK